MTLVLGKAFGLWLVMVIAAILNGLAREKLLTPLIGSGISLPISGISLSGIIFAITFFSIPFFGEISAEVCFSIGAFWVILTLAFEYLFGHYVAGKPWHEINRVFNLARGNLFIVVLFTSAASPWLAAKLRGLL